MGGTSKSSAQTSSTSAPWEPAQAGLKNILGGAADVSPNLTPTETGALNTLSTNAQAGNPYTGQISNLATDLFGGGTDRTGMVNNAYSQYQSQMAPTAAGDYLDPNKNPWFNQVTSTIGNDVQNRVNAMYAGSGRDPSGAGTYGQTIGRGIAEGTAPVFANAYAQERGNQLGAINGLLGAGMGTAGQLSGLDQTALGNRQAGVGMAGSALAAQNYGPTQQLAIEAQRRGIPLGVLQQLTGITAPIAGLGNQSTGTQSGSQTLSGAQQFALIMQGIGSLGALGGQKGLAGLPGMPV